MSRKRLTYFTSLAYQIFDYFDSTKTLDERLVLVKMIPEDLVMHIILPSFLIYKISKSIVYG